MIVRLIVLILAIYVSSSCLVVFAQELGDGTVIGRSVKQSKTDADQSVAARDALYGAIVRIIKEQKERDVAEEEDPCLINQHWCRIEDWCIMEEQVCDGTMHCGDGSDEAGCPLNYEGEDPPGEEWSCEGAACGSDSTDLAASGYPTSPSEYVTGLRGVAAATGHRICEHVDDKDCRVLKPFLVNHAIKPLNYSNGDQKTKCQFYNEWQCRDGTCVSFDALCNRKPDCPDGSDELWTLCFITSLPTSAVVFVLDGAGAPSQSERVFRLKSKESRTTRLPGLPQLPPLEPTEGATLPGLPPKKSEIGVGLPGLPQLPPPEPTERATMPDLPPKKSEIGVGLPGLPQLPPPEPTERATMPDLPPKKSEIGVGLPGLPQLPPPEPTERATLPDLPPKKSEIGVGLPGLPQLPPPEPTERATLPDLPPKKSKIGVGLPGLPQLPPPEPTEGATLPDLPPKKSEIGVGLPGLPQLPPPEPTERATMPGLPPKKSEIGVGLPGLPQLPPPEPTERATLPDLPPKKSKIGVGLPGLPQLPPPEPTEGATLPDLPPKKSEIGVGLPGLPQLPPPEPTERATLPDLPPKKSEIGVGLPGLPQLPPKEPASQPAVLPATPLKNDDPAESEGQRGISQENAANSPRHCKLVPHVSVTYLCSDSAAESRECNDLEPAGTVVMPRCKEYYYAPQTLTPMRCVDGFWDYIARCIPDCGRVPAPVDGWLYPWHAVLYRKGTRRGQYQRVCAGTLVSNSVIISAARCFWSGALAPAAEFAVAVGKKYQQWNASNEHAQTSSVQNIIVPPRFKGNDLKFQDDIAIVVVSEPFVWSASVAPACIDFDINFDNNQLQTKNNGEVVRWKDQDNGTAISKSSFKYTDVMKCIVDAPLAYAGYITSDKICASDNQAPPLCEVDQGAGFMFPDAERYEFRYYLRAVTSVVTGEDGCMLKSMPYATFTQLYKHKTFIQQYYNALLALDNSRSAESAPKGPGDSKCALPRVPEHGSYVTNASVMANVTGDVTDTFELVTLTVSCQRGYGVIGPSSIQCYNGFWPDPVPQCTQLCSLPPHPSVEYSCLLAGGGARVCGEYEPVGAVAAPRCRAPDYYSLAPLPFMRCKDDARWDYIATCKPDCGRATPVGTTLAVGGENAQRGEIPWHAGIYDKLSRPYMQVCGGSLISNDLVISAAHCFWKGGPQPAEQFAVAVGKLYRPWNDPIDEAQKSDVKFIHIPTRFRGSESNFQDDIAVVVVAKPFTYRSYIRPVCLSFDTNFERRQLQTINKGKVAGWGLTSENGKSSPTLQVLTLPYVEVEACIRTAPAAFVQYITSDKICAGTKEPSTALCRGDSGGGLVFPANDSFVERHYLRGVVSTAATDENNNLCNTRTYTSFTQVSQHEAFILPYLNDF